ncbi:TonB family protein [Pleionea sp. CnH1-48]|uniref:TonB family protein n=1 Tax=Pleionea sp. CnH1-48 TaxID=2954494 RepID=UPI002097A2CD|nr:TonB family protein [Pleionea sp. CnH1-48]MCO7222994.1 TonB family protein [Pleionea sp. CnH1-48]
MNLRQLFSRLSSILVLSLISLTCYGMETATLEDGSQVQLKGIGLAKELRNDVYIGALFVPPGVNSLNVIKENSTAKRMSLRFVIDNYSNRKIGRHWKERIAMNNPREVWRPLTKEIVTFSNLFKENFIRGDEINLDFVPGKGTLVYINDVLFDTIQNPDFFSLLMNAWVGSVPPTKAFKEGILGESSQSTSKNLKTKFVALAPIKGRIKLPEPEVVEAPVETVAAKTQPAKKPAATPKKTTPKPTPKPPVKKVVKKDPPKKTPEKTQVAVVKKPVIKPTVRPKIQLPEPEFEDDYIDADLIRGSFVRELISEVRKNQTYPVKALRNGEQGEGTAHVIIDRSGELIEVMLLERTGSRELDKAVIKMIRKSAPFPRVPEELEEPQFEFDVPIVFQL